LIEVSVLDGVVQSFFTFGEIIGVYNYILNKKDVSTLVESIILLIVLSLVGGILNDVAFCILLLFAIYKEKRTKEKFHFNHLNLLLALISGQLLIAMLSTYLSKLGLYVFCGVHNLHGLTRFSHMIVGIQVLTMYVIGFLILVVIHKVLANNSLSVNKLHDLRIDKHFFGVLLVLFGSIEVLMVVSNFQGVTATIQLTLLITFILMVGLMGWQMIEIAKVYIWQKTLENEKLQNEQLSNYLKNVEQQYIELRKFKHDYKNLVVSLNAQNDMSEVKAYLANAIDNEVLDTSLNDVKIAQVQHLKNKAIRGLVVQKFFYAKKCNVELDIEISGDTFQIKKNTTVIVRIIGNLLDNAIEQATKIADKKVTMAFNNINGTMEISVNNAVDPEFDPHKIFKTGYSTKGDSRGLGLANVRDLVDHQHGFYLDVGSKSGYVTMTLIIMEDK